MPAGEWVIYFCRVQKIDWDKLTRTEQLDITRRVPCNIHCWRVGESVDVQPGKACPECGQKRLPRTRYEVLMEDNALLLH